jgi:uncharacterized membrane protein YciS (DUF1049 family)
MIVIIGLIIVIAAVIVSVAAVAGNGGSAHALPHGFAVLGYHMTVSAGTLFLCGMVAGAITVCGLILLLAGARRTARRGRAGRRRLQQSRRETAAVSRERDDLIGQREAALTADPESLDGQAAPDIPAAAAGISDIPAAAAAPAE